MIYLKINEKAIAKARPRFNFQTKTTYTPAKTKEYENKIRIAFWDNYDLDACYQKEPLECIIKAFYSIPKSYTLKKKAECVNKPYMHKPDCDNIAKAILDALNGLAYRDDIQIVKLLVEKYYTVNESFIEILIKGVDENV